MKWINFLDINSASFPQKIAVIDQRTNRSYTYSDLSDISNGWAVYLERSGIKKGDRIAILASNRFEHLSLMFAAARLGAILIPLNFRLSVGEINSILKRVQVKILFSEGILVHQFTGKYVDFNCFDITKINELSMQHVDLSLRFEATAAELEDDILMQFTSGSTGEPKGVLMHGKMLRTNQIETCNHWKLTSDDITMVETPFFHTGGYNVLCLPLLYLGGTVILAEKFDIQNVLQTISGNRVSVYFGVPTMFQMMTTNENFDSYDLSSIRFFVSGGAACPVDLIERYQEKNLPFKQGFGLTEVGPNCFLLGAKDSLRKVGSIGRPMSHSKVQVKNSRGELVEVGETGELMISGDHLCRGYFNASDKFQNACDGKYFKTGDLVQFDDEGFFFVVGRIKDMYISGGENVYPGEVEKQLLTIDGIEDAVVVSKESSKWGEVGHAYLQIGRDVETDFSVEGIREKLFDKLSRYKLPQSVQCLSEFPLLANGKINRAQLKEMANRN